MWFSTLTYPVEQPYRLRWITEVFYAGSAILIVLLVFFNLALVGYEEVMILQPDPNIDYDQWWAPKSLPSTLRFRTKPGDCQDTNLPLDTALRTNSSLPLFTYYVTNNLNQFDSQKDGLGLGTETPYKADPMNICHVQNMTLTMEPRMLAFTVSTSILCDPVGKPPQARRFQTSFKRARDSRFRSDSILSYMAYTASPNETDLTRYEGLSQDGPPSDPYINALGVVDALGADLIHVMWMRKDTWHLVSSNPDDLTPIPELGYMSWDSRNDSRPPNDSSRLSWGTYVEGIWYEGNYIRAINTTIVNVFLAVRDAIYLDLGSISPTNIYTNKTSFNSLIQVEPFIKSWLGPTIWNNNAQGISTSTTLCSWGWGCPSNVNITWAQAFTSTEQPINNITLPINLPSPLPPSTIKMVYVCPQYRRKSWGSLLTSVFIGTFTMYVTLHGIFAWIAPELDRKRKGPQPWERYIRQHSSSPSYELHTGPLTPQNIVYTSSPYLPEFGDDKTRLLDEDKGRTSM